MQKRLRHLMKKHVLMCAVLLGVGSGNVWGSTTAEPIGYMNSSPSGGLDYGKIKPLFLKAQKDVFEAILDENDGVIVDFEAEIKTLLGAGKKVGSHMWRCTASDAHKHYNRAMQKVRSGQNPSDEVKKVFRCLAFIKTTDLDDDRNINKNNKHYTHVILSRMLKDFDRRVEALGGNEEAKAKAQFEGSTNPLYVMILGVLLNPRAYAWKGSIPEEMGPIVGITNPDEFSDRAGQSWHWGHFWLNPDEDKALQIDPNLIDKNRTRSLLRGGLKQMLTRTQYDLNQNNKDLAIAVIQAMSTTNFSRQADYAKTLIEKILPYHGGYAFTGDPSAHRKDFGEKVGGFTRRVANWFHRKAEAAVGG